MGGGVGKGNGVMKRQDTLIRLRRFRVDEIKRRMATLDGMKADVERKLADLEDSVARERQRAGDSDIGRLAFPSFLRSIEDAPRKPARHAEGNRARTRRPPRPISTPPSRISRAWNSPPSSRPSAWPKSKPRRAQSRLDEMALVRHLRKHALRSA